MKATRIFCSLLTAVLMMFAASSLQSSQKEKKNEMLVSTEWLAKHIQDKSLVILHIGDKKEYEAEHIPGAQHIALADISKPRGEGLSLELPSLEKLKDAFERFGISNDSRIILYFGKDWMSPTTRVYWTLDYIGMSHRTSILDGGLPAWRTTGGTTTAEVSTVARGSLAIHPRNDVLVECDWVKNHLSKKKVALIDTRHPEFYDGTKAGMMPRAGHIPSAVSLPFGELADSTNKMKSLEELRTLFVNAGAERGDTVITYCHIGQQATLGYFAARMLGYEARLYDGSFDEWSRNSELPVVGHVQK
jgi:thiosulfate/3-mercaptopyruvate sulfurtransferase